jgi:outer membrane immunogenic protein
MRKFLVASLFAASAIATPALAQDEVNHSFTGPRIEGTLGWDHVVAGSSIDNDNRRDDQSTDGLLYGGGIGYDIAVGHFLAGVEGEATGSTASSDRRSYDSNFGLGRVRAGRDLYAGARIGALVSPTTMLYVKGGYTNAQFNILAGNSDQSTDTKFRLDGYRVGAGVEHSIGRNTYAKVEYRYSNYSNGRIDYGNGAASNHFDVDTDRHQITASYGIRF